VITRRYATFPVRVAFRKPNRTGDFPVVVVITANLNVIEKGEEVKCQESASRMTARP
jgi:hypothetical protein